jgi:aryl-alcohol dehydrogenase-like predicted oxidoreductase
MPEAIPSLATYTLLGRSGLRVSPLCLGTMTFGTEWGWGAPEETARRIFDEYLDAGGNFVDTANGYTNGKSEEMVGRFMKDRRERVVLATKYTFNVQPGNANAGGNGRKNLMASLDASLRRLQTDYIDLYWMHAWDGITPIEEVMSTMNDLVRAGKIRAIGLSDVPAWYLARAQTMAERRGWERVAATQLEYSLIERYIEREHVPAAIELGIALLPWSPLGGGLLSGKYQRHPDGGGKGEGRLEITKAPPPSSSKAPTNRAPGDRFTEENFRVVDGLVAVAKELGRPPAQVALSWITKRPGVVSTIIGATKPEQLRDNLKALELDIPAKLAANLEELSRPPLVFPYRFFASGPTVTRMLNGGLTVRAEPSWYRPRA